MIIKIFYIDKEKDICTGEKLNLEVLGAVIRRRKNGDGEKQMTSEQDCHVAQR